MKVRAKLIGNKNASPTLISGSQLLLAHTAKEANYISRSIKAGTKVKVIFEANIPAGAGVDIKLGNPKDNSYVQATLSGSQPMDKGFREYVYEADWTQESVHAQVILSGNTANRPRVKNLRMLSV